MISAGCHTFKQHPTLQTQHHRHGGYAVKPHQPGVVRSGFINAAFRIYVSINQWLTYSIWQRVIKRVIETHQKTTFPQDHSFHLLHLLHL
jgi:hypothetical protein